MKATIHRQRNRSMVQRTILGGIVLGLATSSAFAATYYVSTTGNDSTAGSQTAPWRTIQHAANTVVAGDTVLVNTGVYREKVSFTRNGAAGQKITFKNAAGQFPVIDGQGVAIGQWETLVGFNNVGYIHLEGFEIRNSTAYNVWVGGEAHHLEIQGLNIHNGSSSGIWLDGPKIRPAMSIISGNKVHDHQQGGITVWSATGGYYRIEGNEIWGNLGIGNYDGIQVGGGNGGTHHVVVKSNLVHNNGSANTGEDPIDLGGHGLNHHYLVEANVMSQNTGSFKLHSGSLAAGYYLPGISGYHIARFNRMVGIGYVSYGFPNPVVLYNNTFINPGQGFMIYNEGAIANHSEGDTTYTGGDAGRMNVKNNIFWQDVPSNEYMILTAGAGSIDLTYRSVRFQNNLYKFSPGQKLGWNSVVGPSISTSTFAAYQNGHAPDNPDAGSVMTSVAWAQMFAGTNDYHLVAGSPAIGKGAALTKAVAAGTNSKLLKVDRASYFQDGYCVDGECLNTSDSIVIGNGGPVRVASINDATNVITLETPATWAAGASVTLPTSGAPDIGAYEYAAAGTRLPPPTNLHVTAVQ